MERTKRREGGGRKVGSGDIDMLALNAPLVLTKVGAWPVHLFQHGLVLRRAVARVACPHRQRD